MRSAERGILVIEVVLSSGILFLVMVLLLNLTTTSIWGTRQGGERLAAENRAQSVLEEYRGAPFSTYPMGQSIPLEPYRENGTVFLTTVRADSVPGFDATHLRHLTVTVSWSSQRGPQRVGMELYVNPLLR